MLKSVLLFFAGLLVGANLVYFFMSRGGPDAAAPAAGGSPSDTAPTALPADAGGASPTAPPELTPPPPPQGTVTPTTEAPTPTVPSASITAMPGGAGANAAPASSGLLLPVGGVRPEQLSNTFDDTRGGTTRLHEALDIMAPRGTPVLAAVDGKVEKLFTSAQGGLTVYQFDTARNYAYYYAHLDRYAESLREGQTLRRGDVIGAVGSTGNASPDGPHLHFAIFLLGPEKQWWKGTPVNPYPLLVAR